MMEKQLAQLHVPGLPDALGGGTNPATNFGVSAAGKLISGVTNLLLVVALVGAFIYLIIGGIQWVTSGGDKSALENARNRITNAILGLVIVAAAWAIWILVGAFFGIDVKNLPFPTVNQDGTAVQQTQGSSLIPL